MAQQRRQEAAAAVTGHLELCYPSEYVKAADLRGKDVTVTIDHLEWEALVMQGGKRDRKVVVHLRTVSGKVIEKRWVVGKTVLRQIRDALGGETEIGKWSGGKITMYPTTCRGSEGKMVECIRVRFKASQGQAEPTEEMMATPAPRPAFLDEVEHVEDPEQKAGA